MLDYDPDGETVKVAETHSHPAEIWQLAACPAGNQRMLLSVYSEGKWRCSGMTCCGPDLYDLGTIVCLVYTSAACRHCRQVHALASDQYGLHVISHICKVAQARWMAVSAGRVPEALAVGLRSQSWGLS